MEYYIANQTLCQQMLKNPDVWKEIPLLNSAPLCNFKDKQLVRFRGMIQDMYDPEYYLEQYEVKNSMTGESDIRCGLYIDVAHCLVDYFLFLLYILFCYIYLFYFHIYLKFVCIYIWLCN